MNRHQKRPNHEPGGRHEPDSRGEPDTTAAAEAIDPTVPLGLWRRMRIRWRHRAEWNPDVWAVRVRFDELVTANQWDLAANIDELNERYRY